METQETSNNQSNLENEKQSWSKLDSFTADYTIKQQQSKQYGTGTKTEIPINRTGQKVQRLNPGMYSHLIYDKESRIYNGDKTIALISDAEKTE